MSFDTIVIYVCVLISYIQADDTCTKDSCTVEYLSQETLPIVVIDYNELLNQHNLSNSIEVAYGRTGLGILLVKDVPDLKTKRENLLRNSRRLAHLDEETKQSLEDKDSLYSIGYSHGKEMLAKDRPDLRKMSYYGNPLANDITNGNDELITRYRPVYGVNIWPTQHLPQLEASFMELGTLIHSVGQLIAHQLDQYVMTQREGYTPGLFKDVIGSNVPKARLLYYFSDNEMSSLYNIDDENEGKDRNDNWCGWHNDHSALTGLILGMFFDENGDIVEDIAHYKNNVDAKGGLYIKTRENITYSVELTEEQSATYLAFQIGETSQILSGGALVATPHSVMTYKSNDYYTISRASFAVFHQPHHDLSMMAPYHKGVTLEQVSFDRFLPENVPTLSSRWCNATGDTFGEFSTRTMETYYNMKMSY